MAERAFDGFDMELSTDLRRFADVEHEPEMPAASIVIMPVLGSRRVVLFQATVTGRLAMPRRES